MAASIIVVTCHNPSCQKEFNKRIAEFKRSERLGRLHFCSKSCFGKFKGLTNFGDKANKDTSYLRNIIRRDEYSPFRNHLKVMKKSAKHRKHECSVTLADLKQLWEKQQGICPYTGWNLVLLPSTTDYQNTILTIDRASVDRIESSLGYNNRYSIYYAYAQRIRITCDGRKRMVNTFFRTALSLHSKLQR